MIVDQISNLDSREFNSFYSKNLTKKIEPINNRILYYLF